MRQIYPAFKRVTKKAAAQLIASIKYIGKEVPREFSEMIAGCHAVVQALLGTLLTWSLTAAGAALVFVFDGSQRKVLDGSLGFAAGVMTAASFWSLLAPAIEMASQSNIYGQNGQYSFVPVSIFLLGAAFVYYADIFLTYLGYDSENICNIFSPNKTEDEKVKNGFNVTAYNSLSDLRDDTKINIVQRRKPNSSQEDVMSNSIENEMDSVTSRTDWMKIFLLIVAITVHNIPEGLAVGVGFGAIGKSPSATLENARNLAIGIGIQNFPEGLAVSLPLVASGLSPLRSFFFGQLSGVVEPLAGVFGAFAVVLVEPILPYALSFAAGAMIYVVVDDIVPEAQSCGNGQLASWCTMAGFVVMMSLDVGLG
ncbi:zinc transporter ZIP11-like [Xenia sp. Carnegie-2017]|uniref:zinc transporter ZIP11-like n=1 Tax=Xenia sp. Carnegie-2017 TaxID=2897299 RepID=UPI001F03E84D|nr:zinc transporter ZIP11-like [Xenia sp. Carnegie-2017]